MPKPLTILTPSDREIVVTRAFDAPRDLVWDCYTVPELLKQWYGLPDWEMTVCEIDLRVGGKWRYVTKSPDGFEMGQSGEYREIVKPVRIVNTEVFDMDWTGGETLCTMTMERDGDDRTIVTIKVLYANKEARDGALASPMAEGMEIGFKRLDEFLVRQAAA
jgi:uncharacterized protein YndB with AHSA1/START domain